MSTTLPDDLTGTADDASAETPRLAPIDDPSAWKTRLAYLRTIVTRLCLDELSAARRKRETYTGPWLPEPVVDSGDRPDRAAEQSDAVSYGLLVVLDRLPPRRPVEGREHVTRFLLGIAEQADEGLEVHFVRVNGRPGLLATVEDAPQSVWAFEVRDDRIQNAYAVLNPEKLRHLGTDEGT
jgi:hypothetical protein